MYILKSNEALTTVTVTAAKLFPSFVMYTS